MTKTGYILFSVWGLALSACQSIPEHMDEAASNAGTPIAQRTQALGTAPSAMPGWVRDPGTSAFNSGIEVNRVDATALLRINGADGSTTVWKNGYFTARRHSFAPLRDPMPDGVAHQYFVRDYFLRSGIPKDQIGEIRTLPGLDVSGKVGSDEKTTRLATYTTIISREVSGIRVEESHAWAQLDRDGNVIGEDVWWPEVSSDIMSDLQKFQAALASDASSFRARLPADIRDKEGHLSIHHTIPILAQTAHVSFDIVEGEQTRRFDLSGIEVSAVAAQAPRPALSK